MKNILFAILALSSSLVFAQNEKGTYINYFNHYYKDSIMTDAQKQEPKGRSQFKMDASSVKHPGAPESFTQAWCNKPVSQGNTGTCWCFSTNSFFEAEIFRLSQKKVNLSEAYIVYWEYVEKAREFVKSRGTSHFGEGSETNAVLRVMKQYGALPENEYDGKKGHNQHHNHEGMFEEMETYLQSVKKNSAWNEEIVTATIKDMLNHHLGTPPDAIKIDGTSYSPGSFIKSYCKLKPNDYMEFMSLKVKPFNTYAEYDVPDNWWNSDQYYNVAMNDFKAVIDNALENRYTISIGGDVSEPGYLPLNDMAYVPAFDISHDNINDDARQLRFDNGSTTDDHAMHLIGYKDSKNGRWYLIKDSGSSSRNGKYSGYMMFHESYIKLKMMTITVHKQAAKKWVK